MEKTEKKQKQTASNNPRAVIPKDIIPNPEIFVGPQELREAIESRTKRYSTIREKLAQLQEAVDKENLGEFGSEVLRSQQSATYQAVDQFARSMRYLHHAVEQVTDSVLQDEFVAEPVVLPLIQLSVFKEFEDLKDVSKRVQDISQQIRQSQSLSQKFRDDAMLDQFAQDPTRNKLDKGQASIQTAPIEQNIAGLVGLEPELYQKKTVKQTLKDYAQMQIDYVKQSLNMFEMMQQKLDSVNGNDPAKFKLTYKHVYKKHPNIADIAATVDYLNQKVGDGLVSDVIRTQNVSNYDSRVALKPQPIASAPVKKKLVPMASSRQEALAAKQLTGQDISERKRDVKESDRDKYAKGWKLFQSLFFDKDNPLPDDFDDTASVTSKMSESTKANKILAKRTAREEMLQEASQLKRNTDRVSFVLQKVGIEIPNGSTGISEDSAVKYLEQMKDSNRSQVAEVNEDKLQKILVKELQLQNRFQPYYSSMDIGKTPLQIQQNDGLQILIRSKAFKEFEKRADWFRTGDLGYTGHMGAKLVSKLLDKNQNGYQALYDSDPLYTKTVPKSSLSEKQEPFVQQFFEDQVVRFNNLAQKNIDDLNQKFQAENTSQSVRDATLLKAKTDKELLKDMMINTMAGPVLKQYQAFVNHPVYKQDIGDKVFVELPQQEIFLQPRLFSRTDIYTAGGISKIDRSLYDVDKLHQKIQSRQEATGIQDAWNIAFNDINEFVFRSAYQRAMVDDVNFGSAVPLQSFKDIDSFTRHLNNTFIVEDDFLNPLGKVEMEDFYRRTLGLQSVLAEKGRQLTNRDIKAGLRATMIRKLYDALDYADTEEERDRKRLYIQLAITDENQPELFRKHNIIATQGGSKLLRYIADELTDGYMQDLSAINFPGSQEFRDKYTRGRYYAFNRQFIEPDADRIYGISENIGPLFAIRQILKPLKLGDDKPESQMKKDLFVTDFQGDQDEDEDSNNRLKESSLGIKTKMKASAGKKSVYTKEQAKNYYQGFVSGGKSILGVADDDVDALLGIESVNDFQREFNNYDMFQMYQDYAGSVRKNKDRYVTPQTVQRKRFEEGLPPLKQTTTTEPSLFMEGDDGVKVYPSNLVGFDQDGDVFNAVFAPNRKNAKVYGMDTALGRMIDFKEQLLQDHEIFKLDQKNRMAPDTNVDELRKQEEYCCVCLGSATEGTNAQYTQCCGRLLHDGCLKKTFAEWTKSFATPGLQTACPYCNYIGTGLITNPTGSIHYRRKFVQNRPFDPLEESDKWLQYLSKRQTNDPNFQYSTDLFQKLFETRINENLPYTAEHVFVPKQAVQLKGKTKQLDQQQQLLLGRMSKVLDRGNDDTVNPNMTITDLRAFFDVNARSILDSKKHLFNVPDAVSQFVPNEDIIQEAVQMLDEVIESQKSMKKRNAVVGQLTDSMEIDPFHGVVYHNVPLAIQNESVAEVEEMQKQPTLQQQEVLKEEQKSQRRQSEDNVEMDQPSQEEEIEYIDTSSKQEQQNQDVMMVADAVPQQVQRAPPTNDNGGQVQLFRAQMFEQVVSNTPLQTFNMFQQQQQQQQQDMFLKSSSNAFLQKQGLVMKELEQIGRVGASNDNFLQLTDSVKTYLDDLSGQLLTDYRVNEMYSDTLANSLKGVGNLMQTSSQYGKTAMELATKNLMEADMAKQQLQQSVNELQQIRGGELDKLSNKYIAKLDGDISEFKDLFFQIERRSQDFDRVQKDYQNIFMPRMRDIYNNDADLAQIIGQEFPLDVKSLLKLKPSVLANIKNRVEDLNLRRQNQLVDADKRMQDLESGFQQIVTEKQSLLNDREQQYGKTLALAKQVFQRDDVEGMLLQGQRFGDKLQSLERVIQDKLQRERNANNEIRKEQKALLILQDKLAGFTNDANLTQVDIDRLDQNLQSRLQSRGLVEDRIDWQSKTRGDLLGIYSQGLRKLEEQNVSKKQTFKDIQKLDDEINTASTNLQKTDNQLKSQMQLFDQTLQAFYNAAKIPQADRKKFKDASEVEQERLGITSVIRQAIDKNSTSIDNVKALANMLQEDASRIGKLKSTYQSEKAKMLEKEDQLRKVLGSKIKSIDEFDDLDKYGQYISQNSSDMIKKIDEKTEAINNISTSYDLLSRRVNEFDQKEQSYSKNVSQVREKLKLVNYPGKAADLDAVPDDQLNSEIDKIVDATRKYTQLDTQSKILLEKYKTEANQYSQSVERFNKQHSDLRGEIGLMFNRANYAGKSMNLTSLDDRQIASEIQTMVNYVNTVKREIDKLEIDKIAIAQNVQDLQSNLSDKKKLAEELEKQKQNALIYTQRVGILDQSIKGTQQYIQELTAAQTLVAKGQMDQVDQKLQKEIGWANTQITTHKQLKESILRHKDNFEPEVYDFLVSQLQPANGNRPSFEEETKDVIVHMLKTQKIIDDDLPTKEVARQLVDYTGKTLEQKATKLWQIANLKKPSMDDPHAEMRDVGNKKQFVELKRDIEDINKGLLGVTSVMDKFLNIDQQVRFNTKQKFSKQLLDDTMAVFDRQSINAISTTYKDLLGSLKSLASKAQEGSAQEDFWLHTNHSQALQRQLQEISKHFNDLRSMNEKSRTIQNIKSVTDSFVKDLASTGQVEVKKFVTSSNMINASAFLADQLFKAYGGVFMPGSKQIQELKKSTSDGVYKILFENGIGDIVPNKDQVKLHVQEMLTGVLNLYKHDVIQAIAQMADIEDVKESFQSLPSEDLAKIISRSQKFDPLALQANQARFRQADLEQYYYNVPALMSATQKIKEEMAPIKQSNANVRAGVANPDMIRQAVKTSVSKFGGTFVGNKSLLPYKKSDSLFDSSVLTHKGELRNYQMSLKPEEIPQHKQSLLVAKQEQDVLKTSGSILSQADQNHLQSVFDRTYNHLVQSIIPQYVNKNASYKNDATMQDLAQDPTKGAQFVVDLVDNIDFIVPVLLSEQQQKINNFEPLKKDDIYQTMAVEKLVYLTKDIAEAIHANRDMLRNRLSPHLLDKVREVTDKRVMLDNIRNYVGEKALQFKQWNTSLAEQNVQFIEMAINDIDEMAGDVDRRVQFNKEVDGMAKKVEQTIESMLLRGGFKQYMADPEMRREAQQLSHQASSSVFPRLYPQQANGPAQLAANGVPRQMKYGTSAYQDPSRAQIQYPYQHQQQQQAPPQEQQQQQQNTSGNVAKVDAEKLTKVERLGGISGEEIQFLKGVFLDKTLKRLRIKTEYDTQARDMTKDEVKKCMRIIVKIIVAVYCATVRKMAGKEKEETINRMTKKAESQDPEKLFLATNKFLSKLDEGKKKEEDQKMDEG